MREVSLLFQNKRILLGMFFLSIIVYSTYSIQENSFKLKKITTFEGGVQTCFTRVNQTYTAKLLNDGASSYLTQNFEALTEECFAESIINIDENFKFELPTLIKKLSTLASNVHWFHEDLLAPSEMKSLANGEGRDLGSRFEKIETTKDEILDGTDHFKTVLTKNLGKQKVVFYIAATLLVVMLLLEFLANTKRRLLNNAREIEAHKELLDNGGVQSVKLSEIIRLALEQNELINCAKLFNNYYLQHSFEKVAKAKEKIEKKLSENEKIESLVTPVKKSKQTEVHYNVPDSNIDRIWNDDTIGFMLDETLSVKGALNLDQTFSKIIDLLADKLFSRGIQIDINVNESINVAGNVEAIEQVIFHAISFAIGNTNVSQNEKNVGVQAIKLGDVVAIDINTTGQGFESELLKSKIGSEYKMKSLNMDLDLQITQSILQEIDGKIQLDNRLTQTGNVMGGRIKLILKAAQSSDVKVATPKLVDLKKGSKKEILAQITDQKIN